MFGKTYGVTPGKNFAGAVWDSFSIIEFGDGSSIVYWAWFQADGTVKTGIDYTHDCGLISAANMKVH